MRSLAAAIDMHVYARRGRSAVVAVLAHAWSAVHIDTATVDGGSGFVVSWRARRPAVALHVGETSESSESHFQAVLRRSGAIDLNFAALGVRDGIVGLFTAPPPRAMPTTLSPCMLVNKLPALSRFFSVPTDVQYFSASSTLCEFRLRFAAPMTRQLPAELARVTLAVAIERGHGAGVCRVAKFGVEYAAPGALQTLLGSANVAPPVVSHALAADNDRQLSLLCSKLALDGSRAFRWRLEIAWTTAEAPNESQLCVLPWSSVADTPPPAPPLSGVADLLPGIARAPSDVFVAPFSVSQSPAKQPAAADMSRVPSVPDFVGAALLRMRSDAISADNNDNNNDNNDNNNNSESRHEDVSTNSTAKRRPSSESKRPRRASVDAGPVLSIAVPPPPPPLLLSSVEKKSDAKSHNHDDDDGDADEDENDDDDEDDGDASLATKRQSKTTAAAAAATSSSGKRARKSIASSDGGNDSGDGATSTAGKTAEASAVIAAVTIGSSVTLDKYVLQTFTIEEFEEYFQRIAELRTLTAAEQREVQRQRRLLKNRQSAQSSRQKRKQYIGTLETQIAELKAANDKLQALVKQGAPSAPVAAAAAPAKKLRTAVAAAAGTPPPKPSAGMASPIPPPPPLSTVSAAVAAAGDSRVRTPFAVGECGAHVFEVFHYAAVVPHAEVLCEMLMNRGMALPCVPEFGCVFTAFRCDALWCEAGTGATPFDAAPLVALPAGVASLAPTVDAGCARFSRSLDGRLRNFADAVAWLARHLLLGAPASTPTILPLRDERGAAPPLAHYWRASVHAPPLVDVSSVFGGEPTLAALRGGGAAAMQQQPAPQRMRRSASQAQLAATAAAPPPPPPPPVIAGLNALDLLSLGVAPTVDELSAVTVLDESIGRGHSLAVPADELHDAAPVSRRSIDAVFVLLHGAGEPDGGAWARVEALATACELYFTVASGGRVALNVRVVPVKI
jgi:hypothetical protein